MTHQDIQNFSTDVIKAECSAHNVAIQQIILFGSQARKTALPDSDWDFLVSINTELSFPEKARIVAAIQRKLAEQHISIDVIFKSQQTINRERNSTGVITYYALKDGVPV
jgi:predicted nucleotidyltransferase